MFETVELVIGGTVIETVNWSNVATEIVGTVCYSSDENKASGCSFGWIPDYERRKLFYNYKPQTTDTKRSCTLCVPLGHFFQSVTSCDNLLYNMNIELRLTRTRNIIGFQTTSINWVVPRVRLNAKGKYLFYKQLETSQEMDCLVRV